MTDPTDSSHEGTDADPPEIGPAGLISVDVIENGGDWAAVCKSAPEAVIEAALAAAGLPEARLAGASAAIALSNDTEVAGLNASYRGKPTPTNVLSFPAPQPASISENAEDERFIGDIILAAETIQREAAELNIPARHHLQHLVVHGLLHLSGFDHESDATAHDMESLETRILASIGLPDPYSDALSVKEAVSS